ncbi:hypothetical protein B296_00020558 [Ensete ventricosum]|uniref:Uncharacterized protein n=1 Tax=Ensete ventricosum TaxID=4639 RepID=A0A426Z7D8_ENSVE|nr:hypothetical protein B296_00020558 [Ensete ventricosum]
MKLCPSLTKVGTRSSQLRMEINSYRSPNHGWSGVPHLSKWGHHVLRLYKDHKAHQQEQLLCEANKGLRRRVRCLILYDASRYLDSHNACCEGKKLTTTDGECSWRRAAMLMEDKYGKTVPIQQLSSNMVMDYSTNWSVNPLHRLGILSEYISSHPQAQFLVFQYQTKDAVVHKSHLLHDFCRYQPDQMPGTSVSTYMPAWLE